MLINCDNNMRVTGRAALVIAGQRSAADGNINT